MKKLHYLMMLVATIIIIVSCAKTETYGDAITGESPEVTVKQILDNPEKYEGKTVLLKGKIKEVCPAGCWFFVNDDFGELYINIGPAGFAIPNKTGHEVSVEGECYTSNGKMTISGKGVEIK